MYYLIGQPGTYCTEGTTVAENCPQGKYSKSSGAESAADCDPCPAGSACASEGETDAPAINCDPGYYCPISATNGPTTETARACPKGAYCDGTERTYILCEFGFYQDEEGQTECKPCPVGFYCNEIGATDTTPCPRGRYCKQYTNDILTGLNSAPALRGTKHAD